jgi:glycosyltransferase involved in cell wall biosynthesis
VNSSQKYKEKLVVFSSRFPYPLEKGDKLRAFYQIQSLSENFDIYLICTSEKKVSIADVEKLKPYCKEIHYFELKKSLIFWNLFKAIFNNKPFQVAFFSQNWIKKEVNSLLDIIKPNHIYCQLIRSTEYVKNYHFCGKTLDIMDALSKGMERRSLKSNFILKLLFKEEATRLLKYERQILNYFENSLIISQQDKSFILYPKDKEIQVIPNGVSGDFLNFELDLENEFDLVFVGNLSYAPNIETSNFIIEKLVPELSKSIPKVKILLSGSSPSPKISRKYNDFITISGWVDDIRTSYLKSKIFIAPMLSGTGMQNKILEAMALGIPCVTTTLANNAILAKNQEEIIIADDINSMCSAIIKLRNDLDFYNLISKNGKNFIKNHYTWQAVNEKLISIIST